MLIPITTSHPLLTLFPLLNQLLLYFPIFLFTYFGDPVSFIMVAYRCMDTLPVTTLLKNVFLPSLATANGSWVLREGWGLTSQSPKC